MTRTAKRPALKRKSAPKSRVIAHRSLGVATVLGIYVSDSGNLIADLDFGGGMKRTLALAQQFFLTPVGGLLPDDPPKPRPKMKEKSVPANEDTDSTEADVDDGETDDADVVELALNDGGRFSDGDSDPESEESPESREDDASGVDAIA